LLLLLWLILLLLLLFVAGVVVLLLTDATVAVGTSTEGTAAAAGAVPSLWAVMVGGRGYGRDEGASV